MFGYEKPLRSGSQIHIRLQISKALCELQSAVFFIVERCVVMAYNILLEFADVTGSSRLAGSLFVR